MEGEERAKIRALMQCRSYAPIVRMVHQAIDPSDFAWDVVDLAITEQDEDALNAVLPYLGVLETSFPLVRAARLGLTRIVEMLIPHSNTSWSGSEALRQAAEHGHTATVKVLLPHSNALANDSAALFEAAWNNHARTVRVLIPHSDPKAKDSRALVEACGLGHVEVVVELLPVSSHIQCALQGFPRAAYSGHLGVAELLLDANLPDPIDTFCAGLNDAVRGGQLTVVRRLLKAIEVVGKPRNFGQKALFQAATDGRADIVAVLLKATDHAAQPEYALVQALEKRHDEVVQLLIDLVDLDAARQAIHKPELLERLETALANRAANEEHSHLALTTPLVRPTKIASEAVVISRL